MIFWDLGNYLAYQQTFMKWSYSWIIFVSVITLVVVLNWVLNFIISFTLILVSFFFALSFYSIILFKSLRTDGYFFTYAIIDNYHTLTAQIFLNYLLGVPFKVIPMSFWYLHISLGTFHCSMAQQEVPSSPWIFFPVPELESVLSPRSSASF